MISVVIPTLNAEAELPATLSALIPGVVSGVIKDLVIADGGSTDATCDVADAAGATIVRTEKGRGRQMIAGAELARADWLLFLHADTVLETGWDHELACFVEAVERGERGEAAAVFRFALEDSGFMPRVIEGGVSIRCRVLGLPYGDQGLLVSKRLYEALGGFKPLDLMEDVDLVRRLGRKRLVTLRSRAVTSATRYKREGYARRVLRNWACLALFYLGVPNRNIAHFYNTR